MHDDYAAAAHHRASIIFGLASIAHKLYFATASSAAASRRHACRIDNAASPASPLWHCRAGLLAGNGVITACGGQPMVRR